MVDKKNVLPGGGPYMPKRYRQERKGSRLIESNQQVSIGMKIELFHNNLNISKLYTLNNEVKPTAKLINSLFDVNP